MKCRDMPLRKTLCATCPFKEGSKYACLREEITKSAMTNGRICHSTGSNGIHKRTGKPSHLCRGARDVQLTLMESLDIIEEATDASWNESRVQYGMKPTVVKDP